MDDGDSTGNDGPGNDGPENDSTGHGLDMERALGALVGKTPDRTGNKVMSLLLTHLLDTAAVGELIWDHYLAPSLCKELDDVAGGGPDSGRELLKWICGVHDLGKATPAFQLRLDDYRGEVQDAGLTWRDGLAKRHPWRHERAGAHLLQPLLKKAGWPAEHIAWVWPQLAAHHGHFVPKSSVPPPPQGLGQPAGDARWDAVRAELVRRLTDELEPGADLAARVPARVPSRALQLLVSGLVVMADWIASARELDGVDKLADLSYAGARDRTEKQWKKIGLRGGWHASPRLGKGTFTDRFGHPPRPVQEVAARVARDSPAPGLLIVEAPTCEGKTWAGLMAAEEFAAAHGADGIFVGMPPKATNSSMFAQVRRWVAAIDPELAPQVALLDPRRHLNEAWSALVKAPRGEQLAAAGDCAEEDGEGPGRRIPAEWFFDVQRGLLCPFVVAPVDQLLYAMTRTSHVMMRAAGLLGKVVLLDEVHAVDVQGAPFLHEGLRWFGEARVPVVLLSATLTAEQRQQLAESYLAGAAGREECAYPELAAISGRPSVTLVWQEPDGSGPRSTATACPSWQRGRRIAVELLPEPEPEHFGDCADVVDLLARELADGGHALVVRNTVDRAQALAGALRTRFAAHEVVVLHEQLTARARAERTTECLRRLAPDRPRTGTGTDTDTGTGPGRLVVVATQVAEQSFDADVDLLVTDLAPVDLLVQRIGRLHRAAGAAPRPAPLVAPRVVVTGYAPGPAGAAPRFPAAVERVHGRAPLLRTAALVFAAAGSGEGWCVPDDVPGLMATAYGERDEVPEGWRADAAAATAEWHKRRSQLADEAVPYLLTRRGSGETATLAGAHATAVAAHRLEEGPAALVADRTLREAVVVLRDGDAYVTLGGTVLGEDGEVPTHALRDELYGDTVELPESCRAAAGGALAPLPGWQWRPDRRHRKQIAGRALVLDRAGRTVRLGGRLLRYDEELGLVDQDAAEGSPAERGPAEEGPAA
ncbi:CRISPR-associated helicase Cas3' [Streptomyces sp. NPDC047315]|uniref:CRISPR-associated helicase Cas3' n=1 Tax=Streptomyces sp. NPDC047315 TaxID=3155142 RepID=UPI0033FBCCBD